MKVLMFGWEFPPYISGGLGTACLGLTKGFQQLGNIDLLFVIPKVPDGSTSENLKLIGANQIPVDKKNPFFKTVRDQTDIIEVDSLARPYLNEAEYEKLKTRSEAQKIKWIDGGENFRINFSGFYGENLLKEVRAYAVIAEEIAAENSFDIIHAHDWLAFQAGIAAKKASGKPLVVHVHATEFDRSGANINPGIYAIEREGMEMADKVIAVSNLTRSTIIEKYYIPEEKVVTVHNGIDSAWKKKNKSSKGFTDKVVTFLGRITMQKGPEYFIEAASMVLKKMDNVRFVMAGSGDLYADSVERVAQLGISDRFFFTGFLRGDDVSRMYGMTDVFVMPSVSEPFGLVPLEAMQANVPVIISNQSGVAEVVKNALKVDFWDTFAMADSIYALLNYQSLSKILVKEGKKEVGKLKWKNSARKIAAIYDELVV